MNRWLLIFCLLGMTLTLFAQDNPDETLIFIQQDSIQTLSLFDSGSTILAEGFKFPIISMMPPVVTSDGLVYFDVRKSILRADIEGSMPLHPITDMPLVSWLPIAISPDETRLLIPTESTENGSELWVGDLDGSNLQQVANIPLMESCGSDGVTPDILEYWSQTGMNGNTPLLAWVDDHQILVSETCFGNRIFSVDLVSGDVVTLTDRITRVKVDTTAQTLAGLMCQDDVCNTIRRVDIATGETQDYPFNANLDQLAWLPDGRLVVSSVAPRGNIAFTPVDEQLALDFVIWFDDAFLGVHKPDSLPLYETTLHIFDPDTGDFTALWTQAGMKGMPVISVANDGIFFSAINDLEAVATAMNNGEERATVATAYPSSTIYFSLLDGSPPVIIVKNAKSPVFFDH